MSNETIADLRSQLFSTLRGLTDKSNPMDIERARAVSEVAQTIINSAKVEVEHLKIAGGEGSGFIPDTPKALPKNASTSGAPDGVTILESRRGVRVTQHKLKG